MPDTDNPKTYSPTWRSGTNMVKLLHKLMTIPHDCDWQALETELGVSTKTLGRYIGAINDALPGTDGEELIHVAKTEGGKRLRMPLIAPQERVLATYHSLYVLRLLASFLKGVEALDGIAGVERDLRAKLRPQQREDLRRLSQKIAYIPFGEKSYDAQSAQITTLIEGVLLQRKVRIEYQGLADDAPKPHTVRPYTLLVFRSGLYLIGFAEDLGEIRTFAVERLASASKSKASFAYPKDYNPKDFLDGSFGVITSPEPHQTVRIKFYGEATVRLVQSRRWHPTQAFEQTGDGAILSLKLRAFAELTNWVLGFGHYAEVLEPAWLRDEIGQELARAAGRYCERA